MSDFFGRSKNEIDYGAIQTHVSHGVAPHAAPLDDNGGISNEQFLKDYRNRMPVHYIEEGSDGYYYWEYGSTMEIEFTLYGEVAVTDPTPPYVVDVRLNGVSVVDQSDGVARINLGSMAFEDVQNYYTREQFDEIVARLNLTLDEVEETADLAREKARKMARDFYAMIGQEPGPGDDLTVMVNVPFTMILHEGQVRVTINGTIFRKMFCVDGASPVAKMEVPVSDLPKETPILAVYRVVEGEDPELYTSFSCLPIEYLSDVIIPTVEREARIRTHNLALDITDED